MRRADAKGEAFATGASLTPDQPSAAFGGVDPMVKLFERYASV